MLDNSLHPYVSSSFDFYDANSPTFPPTSLAALFQSSFLATLLYPYLNIGDPQSLAEALLSNSLRELSLNPKCLLYAICL